MNLLPTPEQQELVAAATRFLAAGRPASGSAAAGHQAGDETRWREMARLGWFAIGVPAADGGAGGSIADQALLFRELGRALVPGPLLGTVLGSALAIAGGREDLGRSLMAGETRAGLAEPWRDPSAGVSDVTGVTGSFRILDAEAGDLVSCLTPDGAALVAAGAVREVAHRLSAPDPSVPVSLARLDGIAPEVVVTGAEPASRLAAHGQVLVATLLVGILEAVRDMSVTYACTREQFGRPI
ncbi:MAG TPA: acyl-CoA dehydrogenase family protein, partial [Acidimicrobiales bacterium]|nr:acyl-CoA dehydrogenase family protein [Acidimicrobiales bacterium]